MSYFESPGPMSQRRFSLFPLIFGASILALCLLFTFAAIQGQYGILRRVQIEAETDDLRAERQALEAELARIANLNHRLSDDYLDLDLLDERARDVLGLIRSDEIVIR